MATLTDKELKALKTPGRYGDGDGLWFQVRKPDADKKKPVVEPARSWLFRYTWQGKQRQMGLGPYPDIGLREARDLAYAGRRAVREGQDPIAAKQAKKATTRAQQSGMTFDNVVQLYIGAHEASWRNPKHAQQWRNTLASYVTPVFGTVQVAAVETGMVMRVLEPLWKGKTETASRVRGRIETVLDYATARGWRVGDNPARWRGHVENLLPKKSKVARVEHHAALPWAEIGSFMAKLAGQAGTSALAMRFTILTAARTGEVIGAKWPEIDFAAKTWTVPADRMKAGREHRVPLSAAALEVLKVMLPARKADGDGFVFPGMKKDTGLSNMSMTAVLKRMERGDLTVHGFRSTFRQWAGESTNVAREVAEAALAHTLKDKVEAAYQRGDMFEKRRKLMADWATFCARVTAPAADVTPIRRAG